VAIEAGDRLHTEVSCKFTRQQVAQELEDAGMVVDSWYLDDRGWYAVAFGGLALGALVRSRRSSGPGLGDREWQLAQPGLTPGCGSGEE
jgi:hypothetical protein